VNILLTPLGTAGDVHPFAGLGAAMAARGHRVTLITSGAFRALANQHGFEFCDVFSADEFETALACPNLWHPLRSYQAFFKMAIVPTIRRVYESVVANIVPGETLVVGPAHAIGARIACEKTRTPLATCHLAPFGFRSVYENRRLPGASLPDWFPPWIKRMAFRLGDRVSDRIVGPCVNGLRAELGLLPVRHIVWHWWNSPELIIGLFPPWFAKPQPDWPPQTRMAGFPLYDGKVLPEASPALSRFMDQGDPPVVVTAGTGMLHGAELFRTSIAACQQLRRRAVLVTRYRQQLPAELPPGVLHVEFAPFAWLLSRAAAVVHHAGIGTLSQAIAAGVPQLARPMATDQPDNAYRLCRLGVAASLTPRAYKVPSVVRALEHLTTSPEVKANCRRWAAQVNGPASIAQACDMLEKHFYARRPAVGAVPAPA